MEAVLRHDGRDDGHEWDNKMKKYLDAFY